jgi:hypothetical protein
MDGHRGTTHRELFVDLFERGVGMLVHILRKPVELLRPQPTRLTHLAFARGDPAAAAALALEFVHPPLAHLKPLGDLSHRRFLLVIGLQYTLAQIQGVSSHEPERYPTVVMCTIL